MLACPLQEHLRGAASYSLQEPSFAPVISKSRGHPSSQDTVSSTASANTPTPAQLSASTPPNHSSVPSHSIITISYCCSSSFSSSSSNSCSPASPSFTAALAPAAVSITFSGCSNSCASCSHICMTASLSISLYPL